jgi:hypothetical protein
LTPPVEEEPNEEIQNIVNDLKVLRLKEVEVQKLIEDTKNSLIKKLDNKNFSWGGVQASRVFRKGSINYKNVPELKNIDLEKYRKPASEFWKITIGG